MLLHHVAAEQLVHIVETRSFADFIIGQRPIAGRPANQSLMWRICCSAMMSPRLG